jgi:thiopurine S-methyltransferase
MLNTLSDLHIQILLITASYNQNEMPGPPFSVDENEVKLLYGSNFMIHKLLDEPTQEIPEHLRAKGLTKARQLVFHLSKV